MPVDAPRVVLAGEIQAEGLSPARREAIVAAAVAQVDRYAPRAPAAVANEAALRYAAALATATLSQSTSMQQSGDARLKFITDHADLFRRCGAAALLSPWKVRRAFAPVATEDL